MHKLREHLGRKGGIEPSIHLFTMCIFIYTCGFPVELFTWPGDYSPRFDFKECATKKGNIHVHYTCHTCTYMYHVHTCTCITYMYK